MKQKIAYAYMHTSIFVPNYGHFKEALSGVATPQKPALEMYLTGNFVELHLKSKDQSDTVLVPITQFTNLVLAK